MTYEYTVYLNNNEGFVKSNDEIVHGEHGITIYTSKTSSYYIPYTSILFIETKKFG